MRINEIVLLLILLKTVCSSTEKDTTIKVDGTIIAKYSNLTGYDLWLPNGSFRWTSSIKSDYICNDWWYDSPVKTTSSKFNSKGFGIVVAVSLLVTIVFSASFPMLVLTTKQNSYIMSIVKQICEDLMIDVETDDNITAKKAKIRIIKRVAYVWMILGMVAMFFVAIVLVNAVFIINGWPSAIKVEKIGYCYYVDKNNMAYSDTMNNKVKMLAEEDENENSEGEEKLVRVQNTAIVSVENTGSRTFFGRCGMQLVEPIVGSGVIWELKSPYQKYCRPIDMQRFVKYHTALWYGCNIGKKCHYEWEMDGNENFSTRFASLCSRHDGEPGENNDKKGIRSNARFGSCAFGVPKFRMRSNEFHIERQEGWEYCEYRTEFDGKYKMYRNGEDMDDFILHASEDNPEHDIYESGWLTRADGSEVIVLDQSLKASKGLGTNFYWGNLSAENWMKEHFNYGAVEYGWQDSEASIPSFRPMSIDPPFKRECTMTFTTKKTVTQFEEFKFYCPDAFARINDEGNVVITTTHDDWCVINVKGNVNGEEVSGSFTLRSGDPKMFRMTSPMYWQCNKTDGPKNMSIAGTCGFSKETQWNEFIPEYYDTKFVITRENGYEGSRAEKDDDNKPSMWSKVKEIFMIIGIVIASLVAAVIIFIITMKLLAKTQCCKDKYPNLAKFGERLCNKNYNSLPQQQPQEITIHISNDNSSKENISNKENNSNKEKV